MQAAQEVANQAEGAVATNMKKSFVLASVLSAFMLFAAAQNKDTSKQKPSLKKTDIELVYSHYNQNGSNSAVTGGIGTEKLTVYAPSIQVKQSKNNFSFSLKLGSDIISSASTDKIDFVKSSASILDARTYANLQISELFPAKKLKISAGTGFSIESDYFSLPLNLAVEKQSKNKSRTLGLDFQVFLDDLRWGRLNSDYYAPQFLIYPSELRYNDWFKTKKRQSYNIKTSLTQIINKRNTIGVFPEFSIQTGLLSTPFHRVYFVDSTVTVERLPGLRTKVSLGLKWYSFVGGRTVLRNSMGLYTDNFGILGISVENETAIKCNSVLTITPNFRIYNQKGSRYFAPYRQHIQSEEFYTSDYDLSNFWTFKPGLGISYFPGKSIGKHMYWQELKLRYSFLYRTNQLHAHMVSMVCNFSHKKVKNKKPDSPVSSVSLL